MTKSTNHLLKKIFASPLLIFIAAPLIMFLPLLVKGQALYWGTPATQFIPWWDFAFSTILQGELPLWNPWVGMGAPLLANYQAAIFYPPYWSLLVSYWLYGITGMTWFISLVVVFHLALSASGTGKILEELGVSKLGQVVGGLAFGMSGYLIARSGFLSINAAAAWFPWMLLYSYRLIKGRKNSLIQLSVVIALQLLAGHAQTTWYSLIFLGFWSIYWIWKNKADLAEINTWWKAPVKLAISGLSALALSSIQLLPTLEYLLESQRAGEYGYTQAMTYSFWPWRFLTLFVPNLFGSPAHSNYWGYGNYWEDAVYIGLLPVIFALVCLVQSLAPKKWENHRKIKFDFALVRFLGFVTIIGFIFALGKNTPVFPFLYRYFPTFDLFQAPTRYSIWAVMSLAILAGLGIEQIKKPSGKARYWTNLAAAGSFAITIGAGLGYFFLRDVNPTFFLPIGLAGLVSLMGMLLVLNTPREEEERKFKVWQSLLILIISVDLIIAGWGLNPGIEKDFYQHEAQTEIAGRLWISPEIEYEIKYNDFFTFNSFDSTSTMSSIFDIPLPNTGMLTQQETVNNFDPLLPRRFQEWMEFSAGFAAISEHPVFDLMDAEMLLTDSGYQENINLANGSHRLEIAKLKGYSEEGEILLRISQWQAEEMPGLILEADQIGLHACQDQGSGSVDILEDGQSSLKAKVDLDQNSWLLWSQTWYPGWHLYLDDEISSPILRGNYSFMAVCVPEGEHTIEFRYQPLSIRIGAFITFASLSLMFGVFLLKKRPIE